MEWKPILHSTKTYIKDNRLLAYVRQINILFIIRDCIRCNSAGT